MENERNRILLERILDEESLEAVFQPILDIGAGRIVGYEGLIRGPQGSNLESPVHLFACARAAGRQHELERMCLRVIWSRFVALDLPGRLFFNLSLELLRRRDKVHGRMYDYMACLGVPAERIVIEITEDERELNYLRLRRIARLYAARGFALAIDDLGAGYASLRLWLELQPAYVKVDMAFVQGVDRDPVKNAFLRAIQTIARNCASCVIAEGIETQHELDAVQDIGILLGQGYFIARPSASPVRSLNVHAREDACSVSL